MGSDSLINGIQELRDAGAEAIELNDTVRVVAQTALRDGPNGGVIADGERIAAPYVIEAIGSAHDLATALDIAQGFTDDIERRGGKVTISEADSVEITSVREPGTDPVRRAGPQRVACAASAGRRPARRLTASHRRSAETCIPRT